MGTDHWLTDTRDSYDTVAESYAAYVRDAIPERPYLRLPLELFAESVRAVGGGPVADVGCGSGHVTAHLDRLGVAAYGLDLSPAMIDLARREHPGLRFEAGSMTEFDAEPGSLGGVIAWQSLIHLPDDEVPGVLARFHRALRPGAPLHLLFHMGGDVRLKTRGYGGHPMKVRVHRRDPGQVTGWLRAAGFEIEAQLLLEPDGEQPQAFVFARRPA
ncbi:class I SAM-dependent methyltransferase [Nonomuraea salmonea]|uniref:Class I SAM-dependent methyltransferase n=1 Tax=Nonomuraea salmonea TaxID=46181 RepID=A0ABV5P3Q3_9ACTN